MLKEALVVSAMMVAVPAAAQERGQKNIPGPVQSEAVPAAATPGAPKAVPPAQSEDGVARRLPTSDTASVTPSTAAPVKTDDGSTQTPPTQVAAIVSREFPAYDSNRNGALEAEEFAAWMAALKVRAPDAKPGDKPSAMWSTACFNKADADKSKSVSPVELASFFNGTKPAAG